jgi:hypothetical protein
MSAERPLSDALVQAVAEPVVYPALLFEGAFRNADGELETLRLWSGLGTLHWNDVDWLGEGQLLGVTQIEESTDIKAIGFTVSLSGQKSSNIALALNSAQRSQGRSGKLWLALFEDDYIEFDFLTQASLLARVGAATCELAFSRADATATVINASGDLEVAAADAPRFDYDPATLEQLGLLIEEGRTNHCKHSAAIGGVAGAGGHGWVTPSGSGVAITIDTDIAPDGTTTADTVTDSNAASTGRVQYNHSTASGTTTRCASWFVKKTSGDPNYGAVLTQYTSGGTSISALSVVNTNTGEIAYNNGGVVKSGVDDAGEYWRVWNSCADNATGNTILACQFYPAWNTTGASGSVAATIGSKVLWGHMIEDGDSPTSLIPTSAATASRNGDELGQLDASAWINTSEGTLVVEFIPHADDATFRRIMSLHNGSATEELYIGIAAGKARCFVVTAGVAQVSIDLGSVTMDEVNRVAFAYKADDFAASLNGGAVATDTSGALPSGLSQLSFKHPTSTTVNANMHLRRANYYPRRVPNADVQALAAAQLKVGWGTKRLIDTPILLKRGKLDVAMIEDRGEEASVAVQYEDRLIDLKRPRDRRYSDQDQKSDFNADRGFEYVARLQDMTILWGRGGNQ